MSKPKKKAKVQYPTLDLHGYTLDQVDDAVDEFLHTYSKKSASRIAIMTGKGSGKVQNKVKEYLKLANYTWEFDTLDNGQRNTGVMIVHMG